MSQWCTFGEWVRGLTGWPLSRLDENTLDRLGEQFELYLDTLNDE